MIMIIYIVLHINTSFTDKYAHAHTHTHTHTHTDVFFSHIYKHILSQIFIFQLNDC